MDLFPYQIEGAKFLATRGRALLADEMGLGKSAQAIAACDALGARDRCVLVICPASLVENWKREFKKFSSGITPIVTSYNKAGTLRTSVPPGDMWDVLILDEAHYLKTPKAKRTKAIFGQKCDGVGGLVERAKHVFCLTGTPTPNNPSELWPMLRAVMPDAIGRFIPGKCSENEVSLGSVKPLTYWQFVQRYCRTQDNGFGIKIVGGKNLGQLKAAIAPFILRRKKDEVLKDLPPIRFDELPLAGELKLPPDATDELLVVQKILQEDGVKGLREIAPHVAQLRRLTGLAKVAPAVEWIASQCEAGQKLVVFAHHRDVLHGLLGGLENAGIGYTMVDGSVASDERQRRVDGFQTQSRYRVFLGQIQAAGTGLTLTAASDMLFVESSWVPAENEQAAMRIHRIGQRNACLVRFATLAGSIDEQIQRAVMRKTADIARLFG